MISLGAVIFHWIEGWDWLDSFYFVVITLTTVGYKDITPTTALGKIIMVYYGLNRIVLLLILFDATRAIRGWNLGSPTTAFRPNELS